jgi:cytochrome c-type biogenesis protein CcmH/NrfG
MLNCLGEVYMLEDRFAEAISAFHGAVGLNPNLVDVQRKMEWLEKTMRGQDPEGVDDGVELEGVPSEG